MRRVFQWRALEPQPSANSAVRPPVTPTPGSQPLCGVHLEQMQASQHQTASSSILKGSCAPSDPK